MEPSISVATRNGNADLDMELVDKVRRMKFEAIEKGNVTTTYSISLIR